jgi:hypothetical protein
MIYKIDNHSETILDLDNKAVYEYILNKYEKKGCPNDEILELMKDVTRDAKKLHEIAIETKVGIYDLLRIIVTEIPEIVDKRFLTRMRKLYNTRNV